MDLEWNSLVSERLRIIAFPVLLTFSPLAASTIQLISGLLSSFLRSLEEYKKRASSTVGLPDHLKVLSRIRAIQLDSKFVERHKLSSKS